jgi:phosphoesterase RecJ-like protein
MYQYLKDNYAEKRIRILYEGKRNNRWAYFECFEQINFAENLRDMLNGVDLLIIMDVAQLRRVIKDAESRSDIEGFEGKIVCIDHHKSEPEKFDLTYIDDEAVATAQVLFELFYEEMPVIPKRTCETLLLGILGDSGSFTYVQPNQSRIFDIAKKLVSNGEISIQSLKAKYTRYDFVVLQIQQILSQHVKIYEIGGWGRFLLTYLDRSEIKELCSNDDAISAACHIFIDAYGRIIRDVNWSVVVYPKFGKNEYAVSLRSLPEGVNVRKIVQGMGIGGGHDLASGGRFVDKISAQECIRALTSWLAENEAR